MYHITGVFSRQGTDHTGEITVLVAVSPTLEISVSFARGKKVVEFLGRVGYIRDDFPCSGDNFDIYIPVFPLRRL